MLAGLDVPADSRIRKSVTVKNTFQKSFDEHIFERSSAAEI